MKKKGSLFFDLLKSTRAYRVFPTLMVLLVSSSLAGFITKEIILLGIALIFVYSSASIINAIKDHDYKIPRYSKLFAVILFVFGVLISTFNLIIFIATLIWGVLGFFYNNYSRKIVLLDSTILSVTHYALPAFISLILLDFEINQAIIFSGFLFLVFWFFIPIKNLKGVSKDRRLGYKTLLTQFQKGKTITAILFFVSFILMILSYFIFDLKIFYFVFVFVLLLFTLFLLQNIFRKNESLALKLARGMSMIFLVSLIFCIKNSTILILVLSLMIVLLYFVFFIMQEIGGIPK